MNKTLPIRQGDIWLHPVTNMPDGLVKLDGKTVALGEATGHHHTLLGDVTLYGMPNENGLSVNDRGMFVDVNGVPISDIIAELTKMGFEDVGDNTFENKETRQFTIVPDCDKGALIVHQEHRPRIVPEGKYQRVIQVENSLSGVYRVID